MHAKVKLKIIGSLLLIVLMAITSTAFSQSMVIIAAKIPGNLPDTTDNKIWESAQATIIPLAPQVISTPRLYEPSVKEIHIKALHNGQEIAFQVEWEDETKDTRVDVNHFTDAVALEFPSSGAQARPHFAMGDRDNFVNIWHWKAVWQEKNQEEKIYAIVDQFLGGVLADNPISIKKTPIENIVANSYGTVTSMRKNQSHILGLGKHSGKTWTVVFKRALRGDNDYEASFQEGGLVPLALAAWDGHNGERGGRKSVSTWYYVGLATEEKKTVYIYPVLAFFGALIAEAAIILRIRKRKKE